MKRPHQFDPAIIPGIHAKEKEPYLSLKLETRAGCSGGRRATKVMTDQPGLFDDPPILPHQRHSGTSKAAAIAAEPNAGTQRGIVLFLIRCSMEKMRQGMTDEEIQQSAKMNPSTQRPRRVELVKSGLIYDSGETRLTSSGRKAVVWKAINTNAPNANGSEKRYERDGM